MKRLLFAIFVFAFMISGCTFEVEQHSETTQGQSENNEPEMMTIEVGEQEQPGSQIVGGDEDEHGCIPSAGYVWCPEKSECVRPWETDCPSLSPEQQRPE